MRMKVASHTTTAAFRPRPLASFADSRDELLALLDSKASGSFSVADHLHWDLNQSFRMAVNEGFAAESGGAALYSERLSTAR